MFFAHAIVLSVLSVLANAQVVTVTRVVEPTPTITEMSVDLATLSPSLSSKIQGDLNAYETSLVNQPAYFSAALALFSVLPAEDLSSIIANPTKWAEENVDATETATWYTALPSSYRDYYVSVMEAKESIVAEDLAQDSTVLETISYTETSTSTTSIPTTSTTMTDLMSTIIEEAATTSTSTTVVPPPSKTITSTSTTSTSVITMSVPGSAPTERPGARVAGIVAAAGAFGLALL